MEILPIKLLTDEDSSLFGKLALNLAKLQRAGFPVASGVVVTPPEFKLKTVLEHYDFGAKEVFEQSLSLVKKEILSIPVPDNLKKEIKKHDRFLLNGQKVLGVKNLWQVLLTAWLEEIKGRLWKDGFFPGISQNLEPQTVIFIKKVESSGQAFYDSLSDDVVINSSGKIEPEQQKRIYDLVLAANKKLFIPHEYEWILDNGVKLVGIKPYTPSTVIPAKAGIQLTTSRSELDSRLRGNDVKSAVKVLLDLSTSFTIEQNIDGVYIASEKIFDLNKPSDSFDNLVFRIVESALTFPSSPTFVKLPDKSEGMGQVRGTLRLLHQKSLFDPVADSLDFARHKKNLTNIHIVIPYVRGTQELLRIKRELAGRKLMRKNSLQVWMEVCTPENIINLEEYLVAGLDGVVLNLDELISHLNGFDSSVEELVPYKNEVNGLLKFLEDALKLLHKSKMPFITVGSLSLYPQVLEFLVEKGVYGVVVERYEAHSAKDLLHQVEKRLIFRKII